MRLRLGDGSPLLTKKLKFNMLPEDFLCNDVLLESIDNTIHTIERSILPSGDVQIAYDAFQNLIHKEMNSK